MYTRWHSLWLLPLFVVAGAVWTVFRADLILAESLAPELAGRNIALEGVATLDSATAGAIEVTFNRDGITTRPYREATRRFWRTF